MAAQPEPDQEDFAAEPRSVDLREYWLVVRRHWVLVVVLTVVGAVAAVGYGVAKGPTYTATAQVVVTAPTQGPLAQSSQVNAQVNMSTEQTIAQSAPVISHAATILGLRVAALQVAAVKDLTVTVPASTLTTSNVLQISWAAHSPMAAQRGADAFAHSYLYYRHQELDGQITVLTKTLQSQLKRIQGELGTLSTQLSGDLASSTRRTLNIRFNQLSGQGSTAQSQLAALPTYNDSGGVFIRAAIPSRPSGFGHSVLLALGVLLGLLLGLVVAFVRDAFDDKLRDPGQLERRLEAPTLAVLPRTDGGRDGGSRQSPQIAIAARPEGRAADAVRVLRATVVALSARRDLRTLLVVAVDGSVPAGRVAAELGLALAESGRSVLLVASDLRGSVLPQIFDVANRAGLSDLLAKDGDPEILARQPRQASGVTLPGAIVRRLSVLPSGQLIGYGASVLDSSDMLELLASLRSAYDFVLLDAPPTVVADAYALAPHVDGVLVLADEAQTGGRAVEAVRRRLDQVGAAVVGGVFITKAGAHRHRHGQPGTEPAASRADASEPRIRSSEPRTHAAEPRAHAAEPRAHAAEPRTHAAEPRAFASEPRTRPSELRPRPAEQPARIPPPPPPSSPPPPATRPMPAVTDDRPPTPAKRSL
jgi:polysaccharide biosynthesis transport protein